MTPTSSMRSMRTRGIPTPCSSPIRTCMQISRTASMLRAWRSCLRFTILFAMGTRPQFRRSFCPLIIILGASGSKKRMVRRELQGEEKSKLIPLLCHVTSPKQLDIYWPRLILSELHVSHDPQHDNGHGHVHVHPCR